VSLLAHTWLIFFWVVHATLNRSIFVRVEVLQQKHKTPRRVFLLYAHICEMNIRSYCYGDRVEEPPDPLHALADLSISAFKSLSSRCLMSSDKTLRKSWAPTLLVEMGRLSSRAPYLLKIVYVTCSRTSRRERTKWKHPVVITPSLLPTGNLKESMVRRRRGLTQQSHAL